MSIQKNHIKHGIHIRILISNDVLHHKSERFLQWFNTIGWLGDRKGVLSVQPVMRRNKIEGEQAYQGSRVTIFQSVQTVDFSSNSQEQQTRANGI